MSAQSAAACAADTAATAPSRPPTVTPAAKEDPNPKYYTWYFTFNLQACEGNVTSQLRAFESSDIRRKSLGGASILSFSTSADGSPDIRGFISGKYMRKGLVTRWLTHRSHPRISDLQLTGTGSRFASLEIARFLSDSDLLVAGESSVQGRRLRLDTMEASGAPPEKRGRKRKGGTGSAVPGGHQQQLQNVSVSTPPPALPSPPAAGQGCSMGGAATQPAYGPRLLPAALPHLASGWPPPAGRALPPARGPPPPPAPQGGNPPSLHLRPPPRAPEAAAGGAPAVAPSPAPVSVAAAAATSPPGPTPTAGTPSRRL